MKRIIFFFAFILSTVPALATTWYVRPDGGTRYSVNEKSGQCNGEYNAAYPGSGVNQNCAFNDVRYLWTDGSSTTSVSGAPAWGWIGAGGDTYMINCTSDCRVGPSGPNNGQSFGLAGNPFAAGAPPPPSGTASQHTRILGANYASCTSDASKAHINGGYGVTDVFSIANSSYVDVACLNITDHSSCGLFGQMNKCSLNYPLSDYATNGIYTNNNTTNVTITDVRIHGLAGAGMLGATGNNVSLLRVALVGNASSGWDLDDGSGKTGTGTLSLNYVSALWNGCAEQYPIVNANPYQDCTDDLSGGYGDGINTPQAVPSPAWNITIANSVAAYNTQSGFDLFNFGGSLTKSASSLTISQSLAHSNMGQQLKVGAAATVRDNIIVGNCNALRQPIPGAPAGYNSRLSDFCRAGDIAVVLKVDDSSPSIFQFNTVYSANATGLQIGCYGTCTTKSTMDYQDNIFLGFMNNAMYGYPNGGTGAFSTPVSVGVSGLFSNSGSLFSYNSTYQYNGSWSCPSKAFDETESICEDPELIDETWHLFGYGNVAPASGSVIASTGTVVTGVTVDYTGAERPEPPSIGALQPGSNMGVEEITLVAVPNPAGTNDVATLTATVEKTLAESPTGQITFWSGGEALGSAALNNAGSGSLALPTLPVSTYPLIATYTGDANYTPGGSGVITLAVLSGTTTTITAVPNPATLGQTLTLTATVAATSPNSPAPAGTVTFMAGSTVLGTATLSAGKATFATQTLAAGVYSMTAEYSGSVTYGSSTSSALSVKVDAQASTTTLAATPNPVNTGAALVLTATVTGSGSTKPTGSVSFFNGATVLGTGTVNALGVATYSTSALATGSYSLTAQYGGDTNFGESASAAVAVTVNSQTTTTSLTASANSLQAGQALTLTATVKGTSATPTGTVNFMSGSTLLGTATLNGSGVATLATTTAPAGSDSITAQYAGAAGFLASTSTAVSVTVTALATTSTLTPSASGVIFGQSLSLVATIKATGNAPPSGTVNFLNGGTALGSGAVNGSGVATLTTSSLPTGSYKLTAQYSGSAALLGSTSPMVAVVVNAQSTTANLTASPNPVGAGQSLTLTATVAGNGTTPPAGTVTFLNGATVLGTGTLNGSGVATLVTTSLTTVGSYNLTVQYAGNSNFLASTSGVANVSVTAQQQVSPQTQNQTSPSVPSNSNASAPVILYTDLTSGPNSGGENNNGTYLTIYGTNFGATQSSSTVTINGKAVAQYIVWSNTKIGVQVGPVTTGAIVVTVGGVASNNNQTFTVRSGHIYFIGLAVDNSVPPAACATLLAANSYSTPWGLTNYSSTTETNYSYTTMRTPYTYYRCLSVGDTLVFLNGANYPYFDGRGWHASLTPDKMNGVAANPTTIMARPGATAQLGGTGTGIMAPIRDASDGYNVVSGMTLVGGGVNGGTQFSAGWVAVGDRAVGNTISCPDCWGQAGAAMGSTGLILYGNTIQNVSTLVAGGSNKEYHAIYVAGNNIEIGWNTVTNTQAYNGIQVNEDGTPGFYNQSYHDNNISQINGSGINLSTIDPSSGYIKVYNNVIHNVGINNASDGGGADPHNCIAVKGYGSATAPGTVEVYNNTMYDCSSYLNTLPQSAESCAILTLAKQVNVTLNLVNNIVEQPTYAGTSLQDVYFCGGGPGSSITGSNNIWYSVTAPHSTWPTTSLGVIENPLFVSTTNFQLQAGSPALHKGISFGGLTTDVNAVTRPNPPSIGAYE